MAKTQGQGTTVAFASTPALAAVAVKDVDYGALTVAMLDAADMSSTFEEKVASGLVDLGSVTVEIFHDPLLDVQALIGKTAVLTITSPKSVSGSTTQESVVGEATISSYAQKGPLRDLMSATIVFTWTGSSYTHTPES